jgi:alanine racemase
MPAPAPSRALIDLRAYADNLAYLRGRIPTGCRVCAVVKADAYGHGAAACARRAVEAGAEMLAVATVNEAAELRAAGISARLLLMVQPCRDALVDAVECGCEVMISGLDAARELDRIGRSTNRPARIHCKIDTGMSRQGFALAEARAAMEAVAAMEGVETAGIATHFAVADARQDPHTEAQIERFRALCDELDAHAIPRGLRHAANSAAAIAQPDSAFDMIRPGLATYGCWPFDSENAPPEVRPVLRWETEITVIKNLRPGDAVGYGRTYTCQAAERVALLPVGYADGYPRALSNKAEVLIHGRRCPVRGRVSMDQIVVDITAIPEARPGDAAVLIGADGEERITAEELAGLANTISYEIVAGIGRRVERVYTG